jgi:hypothetical protein
MEDAKNKVAEKKIEADKQKAKDDLKAKEEDRRSSERQAEKDRSNDLKIKKLEIKSRPKAISK